MFGAALPVFSNGFGWRSFVVVVALMMFVWYIVGVISATKKSLEQATPPIQPYQTDKYDVRAVIKTDLDAYEKSIDSGTMYANGMTEQVRERAVHGVAGSIDLYRRGLMIVIDREAQEPIAFGSLNRHDPSLWHVGFWVMPWHRGKGLARDAFAAVLGASHQTGIKVVNVGTNAENAPMRSVIAKTGCIFVREGPRAFPDGSTRHTLWFKHRREDDAVDCLVNLPNSRS